MLRRQFVIAVALAASATALAGCGDDEVASDAERFCGEAIVNRDMIVAPPMSNEAEVAATLEIGRAHV